MGTKGMKMLGTECTECGDLRTGVTSAGLDSEGNRIRIRACRNCGYHFTTIEIPFDFVFNRMDVAKPAREADRARAKGVNTKFTAAPRIEYDHFVVSHSDGDHREGRKPQPTVNIRLVRGRKNDRCRRGLHMLWGWNAHIRKDGTRTCRACARVRTNARRKEFRQRFPLIAHEQDAAKRERRRAQRAAAAAERETAA